MRQRYFDVPFALSGDQTAIPDPLQAGGTVSFTEGWNFNYQRDLTTDPAALPIDRSTMNWLFYQITRAIAALQLGTIPEWITAAQNGGTQPAYGKGSEVLYSASGNPPFVKYVSLIDNNTDTPGATGNWQVVADAIATSAQASAGTDNTTIMTPARVAQQDALRALLAGSVTQVFNVAPGSGTQAPQFQQVNPGRLLRTMVFANIGGTQQVSVNGAPFTSTGASGWSALSNTTTIIYEIVGGGGSGGGTVATSSTQVAAAAGGQAGSYVKAIATSGFGGAQTITCGAIGSNAAGASGGNGGTTTFGSIASAPGGNGGNAGIAFANNVPFFNPVPSTSPAPATVSVGAVLNRGGSQPTGGIFIWTSTSSNIQSGNGGSSPLGQGGAGRLNNSGENATGWGSGGGGACVPAAQVPLAGGAGTGGAVIIYEYA